MPHDAQSPSPDFDRLRSLFAAARELPPAERAAFVQRVRQQDADLGEELHQLLQHMQEPTPDPVAPPPTGDSGTNRRADTQVHATETDELLRRLARSPRLDLERYAIEGEIDRGGMGAILRLHDRHLNRRLAMKVLHERDEPRTDLERQLSHQLLGRFLEEAQVTSQLDHPGVVPVHELGLDQRGKVYFTMQLVKGRTARDVFMDAHGGSAEWPLTRALEIVLRVCDTMSFAHDKGVLHRDLKPDNVMVGPFGEVYVMDWGLAKVRGQQDRRDLRIRPDSARSEGQIDSARKRDTEHADSSSVVSMDGQKLGTPSYMPPEQARSEELDERADVYAIGAMLYHLLTGRAPYTTPGVKKVAYRILDEVVAGPPKAIEDLQKGVPAELVAIVGKAMAREREARYPTTAALAADVRAFLAMHAVSAYRTGALVELQLWVKRNKPLAASLAAAVLTLVAGIVLSTTLANQKAVLAAAATKAKDEATKLAEEKGQTVANFHQLSAVVRLKDVLAKQDELWPAWPDKIEALKAWLEKDCAELLAQRPQIEATIAELRSRALPLTAEQVEADRRAAPEFAAFERQQQLVASLRRAQAIRSGTARFELPELPATLRDADVSALNSFAWPRVAPEKADGEQPERTTFGEESLALVAARTAVVKSAETENAFQFLYTLAWAALANGQDGEAQQRTAEALAKAPAQRQDAFLGYQRAIEASIHEAAARLTAAEAKLAELDAKVSERRTWMFGADADSESARFLHDALVGVLAGLNSMEGKERVDVAQRLTWAQRVEAASITIHRERWAQARREILRADGVTASELYRDARIDLPPQMGLVPIGMNPVTRLWEFYDLRSAWDGTSDPATIEIPTHKEDGAIEVKAGTGIVFVLLPGGTVTLGSQNEDKDAPYYDPQHQENEPMHQISLSHFLVARHELTQGQWRRLWTWDAEMQNPSQFRIGLTVGGQKISGSNPVERVDWGMCERLLTRHGMVLPTESQWEFGCRGGTTTAWIVGLNELRGVANLADADAKQLSPNLKCEPWSDGYVVHAPVGRFAANGYGLHDVHGNVWEWCRDWTGEPGRGRAGDGLRLSSDSSDLGRVLRGGGWDERAVHARSSYSSFHAPSARNSSLGLRPARVISK